MFKQIMLTYFFVNAVDHKCNTNIIFESVIHAKKAKIGNVKFAFILAIGDDWTDEFTYNAMPEQAYTIKVGTKAIAAKYYLNDVTDVRSLLSQFEA